MLAVERRNQILEKLQEEKRVVVSELSRIYNVSEETIRRDLDKLDKEGLVTKSYGGAVLNEDNNIDMPFNIRKKHNIAGKQKIAELIEGLVKDGEHIMLDASTTAVFIIKALKKKERLTILTNSIEIMVEASDMPDWNIISTGGTIKKGYLAMVGPKVVRDLSDYYGDKVFLSCKGFSIERGATEGSEQLALVKQGMIKSAGKCIVAVDHSKFGHVAFVKICGLDHIDTVVTDKKPGNEWLALFESNGVQCLYPEGEI